MNYEIKCPCGNAFVISDQQAKSVVTCPACSRALLPMVTPSAATSPDLTAPASSDPTPSSATALPQNSASHDATKRCPFCGEVILAIAKKCKHCGEFLDRELNPMANTPQPGAPATQLPDNAEPVYSLTVSQWDNFWRYLICASIVVFVFIVAVWFKPPYAIPLVLGVTAICLMLAWFFYLSTKSSKCFIRPMRIETEVGVLSKDTNTLEMFRITDVEFKQSFIERILGIGTIRLTTQDPNSPELVLYQIPKAREVYKYIQNQIPIAARQRGAVYMER